MRLSAVSEVLMFSDATEPRECESRWAYERTALAYERTFAAWIRTGLAALAFGIALRGLVHETEGWFFMIAESALIVFSVLCFAAGMRRERRFNGARLGRRSLAIRLLPIMSCVLMAAALAALFGVWTR